MKKLVLFLLLLPFYLFSQQTEFNLKDINALDVDLRDPSNVLSNETYIKIKTDTKLKLKTTGINLKDNAPLFIISISNKLIWIRIEEKLEWKRLNDKIKGNVITYSNLENYQVGLLEDINKAVYKTVENLLNKFIDEFLGQNQKEY